MNVRSVRVASIGVVTLAGLLAPVAAADADLVDSDVAYVGAALHVWDAVPESIRFRVKR